MMSQTPDENKTSRVDIDFKIDPEPVNLEENIENVTINKEAPVTENQEQYGRQLRDRRQIRK